MIPGARSPTVVAGAGAVLSGIAQILVFPRVSWEWLAPVCVVPLLLVLRDLDAKQRVAIGWVSGAVFWGGRATGSIP